MSFQYDEKQRQSVEVKFGDGMIPSETQPKLFDRVGVWLSHRPTPRELLMVDHTEGRQKVQRVCDTVLLWAARVALAALLAIYARAAFHGTLWSDPNWTISNVMVTTFNQNITNFVLFPAFFTICIAYGLKQGRMRVYKGSVVAIIGGIGLMANPVTTNSVEHITCAGIVFLSSFFWYPECNETQFRTFSFASVLFIGTFVFDTASQIVTGRAALTGATMDQSPINSSWYSITSSLCCLTGELGIFATWGCMVQNPLGASDSCIAGTRHKQT